VLLAVLSHATWDGASVGPNAGGGTYMVDSALVEGEICDTMDLRRSVMLEMVCTMKLMSMVYNEDAQ